MWRNPVSNICKASTNIFVLAPLRTQQITRSHFKFIFNLIRKSTMAILLGQSWLVLKSWYLGGGPEQGF